MQSCGICGENHCPMDCDIVQIVSHIPDKVIPSKARLTLPEDLDLIKMADNSYSVVATYFIPKGTQFGPLQAKKLSTLLPMICFPLRIHCNTEDTFLEYYLDTSDENDCNWMMFVNPASDFQEQNMICYQENEDIYFVTVNDIYEGEALKVWYSPYYATKMQKDLLKPIKKEVTPNIKNNECIDTMVKNKKNIRSRDIWSCKFCGKVEKNVSEFTKHLIKHYNIKLKRYCEMCNCSFQKIQGYQNHMKIVHEKDIANKQSESKSNAFQKTEKLSDPLPKENYFGGPLLLNELLNDSTDNTGLVLPNIELSGMDEQSDLFDNEILNLNMESILPDSVKHFENFNFEIAETENEQVVCDICLKVFKKLKHLIYHMHTHTGKYTCFECEKVFARQENLNRHSCNKFYKLKCCYCPKLFYQNKYLQRHLKLTHDQSQQPFGSKAPSKQTQTIPCTVCSKKFTHKNNLIIHVKAHQQRQKYTCPICNTILGSAKTYLKHYKLHEGRVNRCETCGKVFNRRDTLKYHIENFHSAKMEICTVCTKAVKTKKLLQVHMKLHEGETSFKCSQCSKVFKQKRNLSRHIKTGTCSSTCSEETFFKCSQCSKVFKLKKSLARHIKENHLGTSREIESLSLKIKKQYSCPKCDKILYQKKTLKRHFENSHPNEKIDYKLFKPRKANAEILRQGEESVMDLKQTIENMNFATEVNHEITIEIDKLLNDPKNFGSDSNDRMVESLINNAVGGTGLADRRDPMLSMPNLDIDDIC